MSLEIFHAAARLGTYPFKNLNLLLNVLGNAATYSKIRKTKQLFEIARQKHVMLDSGGSTIFNAEKKGKEIISNPALPAYDKKEQINLTPGHVIRAAVALQPDTIVALDWPLQNASDEEFRKKLIINLDWAKETVRLRQEHMPDANLLMPVQARNSNQFEEFMEGLSGLSFTGICLPSRNLTHELLVRFLVRLWQLGIPWVHILGTVSFSNMGIAAYFARQELFQLVSMDSRGWMTSGSKNKFLSPANLLACYINEKTWIPESLRNDCPCPFCRNVSFQDMSFDIYHSRSALLCGHNAWVTELVAGELFKNARTFDQLNHFMMQRKSHNERNTPKAMKALAAAIKKFGI